MKHRFPAIIAAAALLLTGCGKSDTGTDDNSESDIIVTVEAAEETSEVETETDTTDPAETEEETSEEETEVTSEEETSTEEETTEEDNTDDQEAETSTVNEAVPVNTEYIDTFFTLPLGIDSGEAFTLMERAPDRQNDRMYNNSTIYEWDVESDPAFCTHLPGMFYIEISNKDNTVVEVGYELGNAGSEKSLARKFSGDELKTAYDLIVSQMTERFGDPKLSSDEEDMGVLSSRAWKVKNNKDLNWYNVYYGTDLWNEHIGEIIIKKGYL